MTDQPPAFSSSALSSTTESSVRSARIVFTGSGSEYFRIWSVNLFLTYITLGIYSAWAKVRREKYFHQNTLIEGHSLDYHANPISILIGRCIGLGLLGLASNEAFPAMRYIALAIIVLMFPFFMQRSLRFRFKSTSYRGLRFGFSGSARNSYLTVAPFLVVPLGYAVIVALSLFFPKEAMQVWSSMPSLGIAGWIAVAAALGVGYVLFMALFQGAWRRYAINHVHYGFVRANTKFLLRRFVGIQLSTTLIFVGIVLAALALLYVVALAGPSASTTPNGVIGKAMQRLPILFVTWAPLLVVLLYIGVLLMQAVITARTQNYCWNQDASIVTQKSQKLAWFQSDLSLRKYGWLQVKNWLLIIVTLGLYRPFAVISAMKARLQAIQLHNTRFIDFVVAQESASSSAIGDEAMDAFDLEFSI
jgi:uncharacterized membrane protein YjgN (DUF898 family)